MMFVCFVAFRIAAWLTGYAIRQTIFAKTRFILLCMSYRKIDEELSPGLRVAL